MKAEPGRVYLSSHTLGVEEGVSGDHSWLQVVGPFVGTAGSPVLTVLLLILKTWPSLGLITN